jgi:hypothetical protein
MNGRDGNSTSSDNKMWESSLFSNKQFPSPSTSHPISSTCLSSTRSEKIIRGLLRAILIGRLISDPPTPRNPEETGAIKELFKTYAVSMLNAA